MIEYAIQKLTEKLIEQDIKDKKENRIECISKATAYKDLIKLLKEML